MAIISRFLPNPAGNDKAGEWIEILNNGAAPLNLNGWQIKDLSGRGFIFKEPELKAGEASQFDYQTTKMPLNNSGETLFLYDLAGNLVSQLGYRGRAKDGEIIEQKNGNADNLVSKTVSDAGINPLLDLKEIFDSSALLVGSGAALILASVFFWIIKEIYADLFDQISESN